MSSAHTALPKNDLVTLEKARQLALCSMEEARKLIPFATAEAYEILPLGLSSTAEGHILTIASHAALDHERIKELRFLSGCLLNITTLEKNTILHAIKKAYLGSDDRIAGYKATLQAHAQTLPAAESSRRNLGTGPIVEFLDGLFGYAIAHEATDIHIVPVKTGSVVKLRINGIIHQHHEVIGTASTHLQLINRLKILAQLDPSQSNQVQEAQFQPQIAQENTVIRVSIMPTIHGEKASLRILGAYQAPHIASLNLAPSVQTAIERALLKRQGAILCCGPTGSGKTTTLYGMLNELKQQNLEIVTLEDPVEYRLAEATQSSINPKRNLSYAQGLKALLRQDPDVILVGEVRDKECAQVCVEAALSGHLMLSSIHSNSVLGCLLRFKEFGVQMASLIQAVQLILFQQLIPCLCDHCKVIDLQGSNRYGFDVFQAVGCHLCDYSGIAERLPCIEGLSLNTELITQMLNPKFELVDLPGYYSETNYVSLEEQIMKLFEQGKICLPTMQRFSDEQ
ncbi:MAG: Flp pilus assembly complex ATPase component TadA [Bdellovibrionales bacterium]|nr:Flp pilus assembly complex ATPase component TadA [Bdellovibrionales bacterium]